MKKIILTLLISFGIYQTYMSGKIDLFSDNTVKHDELIMYSLTTCGYCKKKVRELDARNIEFTEYFIDIDKESMTELNDKLTKAGFEPKRYGTPIFDVHGVMLPNNPSMDKIIKNLNNE